MKREPVDSSNIAAIGYDPASKILEVEFVRTKPTRTDPDRILTAIVQEFEEVPAEMFETLLSAKSNGFSVGSIFHHQVRDRFRNRQCATLTFSLDDFGVETVEETRIERAA